MIIILLLQRLAMAYLLTTECSLIQEYRDYQMNCRKIRYQYQLYVTGESVQHDRQTLTVRKVVPVSSSP